MSRPKKETPPAKEYQLTIRFTKDLYDALTADAASARLPRTAYIRQLITDHHPVIKQEIVYDNPELLKIFRDLGHYGGNLNQIARYLNQNGTMTNEMWKEIKKCISEIYEIRDTLQKVAGEYRGSH